MSQSNAGRVQVGAVVVAAVLWMWTMAAITSSLSTAAVAVGIPVLSLLSAFHALFYEHVTDTAVRALSGALAVVSVGSLVALYLEATTVVTAVNLLLVGGLVVLALVIRRA